MADSSDQLDRIYSLKTQITKMDFDSKIQLLYDKFGDSKEYFQKNTIYKHSRISIKVTEELNPDGQIISDSMTITTLGAYCKTKDLSKNVFYQKIVISQVSGNAHQFLQTIGEKEDRHWLETGFIFKDEKIQIRIFRLLNDDQSEMFPDTIGVVFEAIRPPTDTQEVICSALYEAYRYLLDGEPVYTPDAI